MARKDGDVGKTRLSGKSRTPYQVGGVRGQAPGPVIYWFPAFAGTMSGCRLEFTPYPPIRGRYHVSTVFSIFCGWIKNRYRCLFIHPGGRKK
jgi:hypothetical protein